MGYCHKCEHDCSEKDPCPCCRRTDNHIPWQPYSDPPFNPITYPREYPKPLRPLREYWCHPDIKLKGYKRQK